MQSSQNLSISGDVDFLNDGEDRKVSVHACSTLERASASVRESLPLWLLGLQGDDWLQVERSWFGFGLHKRFRPQIASALSSVDLSRLRLLDMNDSFVLIDNFPALLDRDSHSG